MDIQEVRRIRNFNRGIYGDRFALTMAMGDAYDAMRLALLRDDEEGYNEASKLFDDLHAELQERFPD